MTATQIDNPFGIGDLVHIPQGTTLYRVILKEQLMVFDRPMPIKVTKLPTAGYIINKSIYDFYIVGIGNDEYMIKSEEINIVNGDTKNVYKTN